MNTRSLRSLIAAAALVTVACVMLSCVSGKLSDRERCLLECDSLYRECADACGGYRMGDTQDARRKDAVLYGGGKCLEGCNTRHDSCRKDCEQFKSYDRIEEK
ncbi:MAG: hypothetical protein EPN93_08100 [Spirochaetes bacterium]|nr:MAG: hypothetical protein EPN93_08100 [Spirochaetota bacterium]